MIARPIPAKALWLLLLVTLTACLPPALPPVVKIGLVAPFEGADRDVGYEAIYAARLAVREINAASGAGRARLELVAYDDRADAGFATTAARNLATDEDVIAAIGHFRPESTAAARPVYAEAGLPLLALGAEDETYPLPETLDGTADWIAAYRAIGPYTPVPGVWALPTYEAVYTLAEAIAAAGAAGEPDRAAVAAALPRIERQGFLGTLHWRAGATPETALIFRMESSARK
ncbi:MAG TPA: ABC transporter substrate-binding protein [Anaerolineae bacterium]|nr:ABC transporter substrate-binding protein [Anaerolineae bacterium]